MIPDENMGYDEAYRLFEGRIENREAENHP
jgi:hypothetical protein